MTVTSYCCDCDAPPGLCEHTSPRYLDAVVHERAAGGWKVPEHERKRWDNPPRFIRAPLPDSEPQPIQRLVIELGAWVDLDAALETQLRSVYEAEPMRVTRAVERVIGDARAGKLVNPGGVLVKRLREITNRTSR